MASRHINKLLLLSAAFAFPSTAIAQAPAPFTISTVAGSSNVPTLPTQDDISATVAYLGNPKSVAIGPDGLLYIAEYGANQIRKVDAQGIIRRVAGTGAPGFAGDGGPATQALLQGPTDLAFDGSGNLYIADTLNHRIRKVAPDGTISTVGGSGETGVLNGGSGGDGGPATSARFNNPMGVAVDAAGNVLVADFGNGRIRKIAADGTITTVAGGGATLGDGGPATSANLFNPQRIAVDGAGSIYITDQAHLRIRKVDRSGTITTVGGNGGLSTTVQEGVQATSTPLAGPVGVAVDAAGSVYFSDPLAARVRVVTGSGLVYTIAGTGSSGFSGDGGPALQARMTNVQGLALDGAGNVYVADLQNSRIRKLTTSAPPAGPVPTFTADAVTNAASPANNGAVAPGEIITVYGTNLGPSNLAGVGVTDGKLNTIAGGVRVLFDGVAAPMIYALNAQVSAIAPYRLAGQTSTSIQVEYNGVRSVARQVKVVPVAPGVFGNPDFTAVVVNQDGTINSVKNPAPRGTIVAFFVTGEGQTTPGGTDGLIAVPPALPAPVAPVTVEIGGRGATVLYAGAVPFVTAGLMQVNAQIAPDASLGVRGDGFTDLGVCVGTSGVCDKSHSVWIK